MNDTRFESCIKCTVCTTTCPVSRVNPRYPGPKQAGPDGERLRLKDGALYDEALKYCINCKRCEVACPSDVKIGDIIQRARAQYGQQKPTLRDAILSHTDLMGTLSTPFAPLVNAATGLKPVRRLLDATLNIDHRRTLPKYGFGTFRRAYRQLAALLEAMDSGKVSGYMTDFPSEDILGRPGIVCTPHLGASTPEAEDNCAIMAAQELSDYLRNGNITHSVNLPEVHQPRAGGKRICIIHKNEPGMISQITALTTEAGLNIENMVNKSKKNMAYTMLDATGAVDARLSEKLSSIPAVIRVRIL